MSSQKSAEVEFSEDVLSALRKRQSAVALLKWLEDGGPRGALAARMHAMAREIVEVTSAELDELKHQIETRGQ